MSSEILLKAEKREGAGSSAARRLRREGKVPAVVYGDNYNQSISLDARDFSYMLNHHASEHVLVELDLDGEKISALLKDVQHEEINGAPKHADFQLVVAGQMLHTTLPVVLVGEAEGTKAGGVLECVTHALDVECLPKDLVEEFSVDVSALNIGDAIHVSDVQALLGDKFSVLTAADSLVAHVVGPKVEEEVEEEAAEAVAE
jgi:large subunit ribosomal protein L25